MAIQTRNESAITVTSLCPALGAEVLGVDLSQPLGDDQFAAIHQAFLDHQVLLFRGQDLEPAAQIAFTRRFGRVDPHPLNTRKGLTEFPELLVLENRSGIRSARNNFWHSDISFAEAPPLGSVLHAREIPGDGKGDTLFCNMYRAYEELSPGMRRMIDGLTAIHDAEEIRQRNNTEDNDGNPIPAIPAPVEHPVARTHPETGRKALYINRYFTRRFTDMTEEESRPLMDLLIDRAIRQENLYRHRWQAGDVLMWDNRCTMHYAIYDYGPDDIRHMHRTTAAGDRPR